VEKFRGLMTSKATPDADVAYLEGVFKDIMTNDKGFINYCTGNDMVLEYQDAKAFGTYLQGVVAEEKQYLTEVGLIKK
jgi:tripartite-type tricarboxylate transporter receptor subunit TctC